MWGKRKGRQEKDENGNAVVSKYSNIGGNPKMEYEKNTLNVL